MTADSAKTITIISVSAIILSGVAILSKSDVPTSILHASSQLVVVSPTLPPAPAVNEIRDVHSPDGTRSLVLVSIKSQNGFTTYSLVTSETGGKGRKKIFDVSLPQGLSVRLSPNSWSPDNLMVFFRVGAPAGEQILVMKADGSPFADGKTSVDLAALFKEKVTDLTLRDVTGWDAPGLLHVFTSDEDGAHGPAYWFEVGSRNFIRLSNS